MADAKKAADAAASTTYVVAMGEIPRRDPKTRRKLQPLGVGDEFKPAADDDVAGLLARGVIVTTEEFAKRAGAAEPLVDSLRQRAEAAEARVAELEKAATPAPAKPAA